MKTNNKSTGQKQGDGFNEGQGEERKEDRTLSRATEREREEKRPGDRRAEGGEARIKAGAAQTETYERGTRVRFCRLAMEGKEKRTYAYNAIRRGNWVRNRSTRRIFSRSFSHHTAKFQR